MPIILVVDDSPTYQKLVGGLLSCDFDWIISYAENGQVALEMMEGLLPDIIVTDLLMPVMDGMQFCRESKTRAPQIPVVLITAHGSEQLAVEALAAGAASYVPKSALAESLAETVRQLLNFSARNRTKDRLMTFTTNMRHQFNLENDPMLIAALLDFVRESMVTLHLGDAPLQRQVSVAIEEALLNAMLHGNLELPVHRVQEVRQSLHSGKASEIVEKQRMKPPFDQRRVRFAIDLTLTRAQFVIRDQGPGFDCTKLTPPDDPNNISNMGHRGLTLIRNFMDEVTFKENGSEIHLSVSFKPPVKPKE
jgi:CheY-like chemotaxis protein/anti-sigma regulatory factor (Ser/Thr protein kinase)